MSIKIYAAMFVCFFQRFHRYHSMAVESKTAEQKLQKMEDSRRKNEKMAKQFEKVPSLVMYREVLKEPFRFLFEDLSWLLLSEGDVMPIKNNNWQWVIIIS